MAETAAGTSAQARADKQRAKAERLLASADRWQRGARGEEVVAQTLRGLPPIYTVLHDRQVPGSKANIDHLVIGPAGVFVVDAKLWSQPLRWSDGMLWRGRYPIRKELDTVTWEAEQASAVLGVPVHPVLCFVGDVLPEPVIDLPPVRATTDAALVGALVAGTAGHDINVISRCTLLADRHLPAATDAKAPPAPPPVRRQAATRRSAPKRASAPTRSTASTLLGAAASLVVALVLMTNAGTIGRWLGDAVTSRLLPTGTASGAEDHKPVPALSLNGDFSCPGPGAGWTLTFLWPGDGATGGYELATSADGATWTPFASWSSSAQAAPLLPGIGPDAAVQVRARSVVGAEAVDGTFRSPALTC